MELHRDDRDLHGVSSTTVELSRASRDRSSRFFPYSAGIVARRSASCGRFGRRLVRRRRSDRWQSPTLDRRVGLDAAWVVFLRPGEGETIFDGRERTIRVLADRDELALTWFRYQPGEDGPEPHVHRRHTDAFYVLEGELELGLGPDVARRTATAGTLAAAPPNVVHTFSNASAGTVVFLNIHAPSMGFAEMLRAARDGREEKAEKFDQFAPPADGGRPLSDAVFRGPGRETRSRSARAALSRRPRVLTWTASSP